MTHIFHVQFSEFPDGHPGYVNVKADAVKVDTSVTFTVSGTTVPVLVVPIEYVLYVERLSMNDAEERGLPPESDS